MGLWEAEGGLLSRYNEERVLVAIVPSLRDWALIQEEHWYRIPLARAPQRIAASYLAFYHPACFTETRWTIPYYAPIERYRVAPRRALLPGEPNHPRAEALYYCLEIGDLIALPRPIPSARLRRLTFIMTTLSRLLSAREVSDLWLCEPPQAGPRRALQLGEAQAQWVPSLALA